jgi:hypothetical protein
VVWMRTMEWSVPVRSKSSRNRNSIRLSAIAWKPRGQSIAPPRAQGAKPRGDRTCSSKRKRNTQQQLEQSHLRTTVAIRSLLSRSWVDWAIEAARRVGAEPVGALGEERVSAAVPKWEWPVQVLLPYGCQHQAPDVRRAAKVIAERKRGAQPCVAKLACDWRGVNGKA